MLLVEPHDARMYLVTANAVSKYEKVYEHESHRCTVRPEVVRYLASSHGLLQESTFNIAKGLITRQGNQTLKDSTTLCRKPHNSSRGSGQGNSL